MKNRIIGVIQWLYVETAQGGHIRYLHPGEAPRAVFELGDETPFMSEQTAHFFAFMKQFYAIS